MIKLNAPLNYKGLLHPAGATLPVDPDLAAKMVKAGTAEYYNPVKAVSEQEPEKKPDPAHEHEPKPEREPEPNKKGGK